MASTTTSENWLATKAAVRQQHCRSCSLTKQPSVRLSCFLLLCQRSTRAFSWKQDKYGYFLYLQQFGITAFKNFPAAFSQTFRSLEAPCPLFTWLKRRRQLIGQPELSDEPAFTCTPLLLPNYPQVCGVLHYPEAQGLLVCQCPNERAERRVPAAAQRSSNASESDWRTLQESRSSDLQTAAHKHMKQESKRQRYEF